MDQDNWTFKLKSVIQLDKFRLQKYTHIYTYIVCKAAFFKDFGHCVDFSIKINTFYKLPNIMYSTIYRRHRF